MSSSYLRTDHVRAEADRLVDRGNQLEDDGRIVEAQACYRQAAQLAPRYPRPHLNLANISLRTGRAAEALATIKAAVDLDPSFAPSHFNLGHFYASSGMAEAAEHELRTALALDPRYQDAAVALANLLDAANRSAEAESVLRQVLQGDVVGAAAAYNLALLLINRGSPDEAESLLLAATSADASFDAAYLALGNLCLHCGRAEDAERWYRVAMTMKTGSLAAHSALLFSLNARDGLDAQFIYQEHLRFGDRLEGQQRSIAPLVLPASGPARRIRVGYLSGDFRRHAVALFMRPVLEHHDREHFEIFCYANVAAEDEVTRQMKPMAEHWRNVAGVDDATAATMVRADQIDILVDLSGHTEGSRLLLLTHRCAPVQITWLGYLNTTGLKFTDYRICDHHTDPAGQSEDRHTERLLRLPHSQWCYEPALRVGDVPRAVTVNPRPTIFGSFNQFWKISKSCLALWLDVLQAVEGSEILVVGVPEGKTMTAFRGQFERRGLGPDRVKFLPRMNTQDYFTSIAGVDIALDTLPYNGATTTLDALWMGVPLVALAGDRSVARSSFSILTSLGLQELIVGSATEYVNLNARLASDSSWRTEVAHGLRSRLQLSPLMNANRFTRDLEDLYRRTLG